LNDYCYLSVLPVIAAVLVRRETYLIHLFAFTSAFSVVLAVIIFSLYCYYQWVG